MNTAAKIESNYCQLFIDSGDGFNEEKSIRIPVSPGENSVVFDLSEYKDINSLRFDPLDNYTTFQSISFEAETKDGSIEVAFQEINGWYLDKEKTQIIFDNRDPNIVLKSIDSFILSISIKFNLKSPESTLEHLNGILKEELKELSSELKKSKSNKSSSESQSNAMSEKLLKSINGKLNLQVSEIDYLKSLFNQIKTSQSNFQKSLESIQGEEGSEEGGNKLDQLKKKLKDTELKLEKKNESLDKLKLEVKLLQDQKATKKEFETALSKTMDIHINRLKTLQEDTLSSMSDSEIQKMKLQNKELNNLVLQYKEQIAILKENEAELKNELGKLHSSNSKRYGQIEVLKEKNKTLRADLKKEKSKLKSVDEDMQRLQVKFDNLKKEFNALTKIEAKHFRLIEELSMLSGQL